jgi:hypothetical protein
MVAKSCFHDENQLILVEECNQTSLEELFCDGNMLGLHLEKIPTFELSSLVSKMDYLQGKEGDGNRC